VFDAAIGDSIKELRGHRAPPNRQVGAFHCAEIVRLVVVPDDVQLTEILHSIESGEP